jgi:hypothetical protein
MSHDATIIGTQPPSAELVVSQGPLPGHRFPLVKPMITVGRQPGNDIVISDPQVSRRHASLSWDGTRWIIQDLGSRNGTFINGVQLTAPGVLQSGDQIGLGSAVLLGFQAQPVAVRPPAQPYAPAPPVYPPAQARHRRSVAVPLAVIVLVLVCLAVAAGVGYLLLRPTTDIGVGRGPDVLINSPHHGDQLEVGRDVTVHSVARDEDKVVRVELWVDDQLHQAQDSNLPGGVSPFPLAIQWRPALSGTHTLTARAFDSQGNRAQASVNVEAAAPADRDGDGVADEVDRCPDEPGRLPASGCPDRDGDGTPDAEDACPDQTGLPEQAGCPVPEEGDADGDGTPDEADVCADVPGPGPAEGCPDADADGVPDSGDACPSEAGWLATDGCPTPGDADGDGVADADDVCPDGFGRPDLEGCPDDDGDDVADGDDACPDEWGPREHDGCPDRDEDGVPDGDDRRPDEPGRADSGGAPDTGAGDRDGDGLSDDVDACPNEAGLAQHDGCPPPSADDTTDDTADGDGGSLLVLIELIGLRLLEVRRVFGVEFQALEFEVDQDYDEVYCYAGLAGADMERHAFEPSGGRRWDIPAELASRTVGVFEDSELEVQAECGAYDVFRSIPEPEPGTFGAGGESATHWDLGAFLNSHPETQWTGEVLEASATGPDGRGYRVAYRLCRDSCEGAVLPPPTIVPLIGLAGSVGQYLGWAWDGDVDMIDGFRLYVNGNYCLDLPKDRSTFDIQWWRPPCGQVREFQMTAYSGHSWNPDRESPPSNVYVWETPPCMRTVRVSFNAFETGFLGEDEYWADASVGPINGYFEATGSNHEVLSFTGTDYGNRAGERDRGLRLRHNTNYYISQFFRVIRDMEASCGINSDCPYHAPTSSSVTIELGPEDDLVIHGNIQDTDSDNDDDTLFDGELILSRWDIVPRRYIISDRNIDLHVSIDVVDVDMTGPPPDERP